MASAKNVAHHANISKFPGTLQMLSCMKVTHLYLWSLPSSESLPRAFCCTSATLFTLSSSARLRNYSPLSYLHKTNPTFTPLKPKFYCTPHPFYRLFLYVEIVIDEVFISGEKLSSRSRIGLCVMPPFHTCRLNTLFISQRRPSKTLHI